MAKAYQPDKVLQVRERRCTYHNVHRVTVKAEKAELSWLWPAVLGL
jgi:hypothetical protein